MVGGVKMFGCVLVLGAVAATYMPAREAEPQVNPRVAHSKAFLAACGFWLHIPDLIDMLAGVRHVAVPSGMLEQNWGSAYPQIKIS